MSSSSANSVLRHAAESAQDTGRNVVADIKSSAGDVKEELAGFRQEMMSYVDKAMSSVKGSAHRAADSASHLYDAARDRTHHLYDAAKDKTATAAHDVHDYVRARPLTSIAVAAGVGVVLGAWFLRRRWH
jgi:ElaB/YqjD/DUF883 family membrane-anchored ribosome-binding protein